MIKELFEQSFKAANPSINVLPGYPVHDVLIAPLATAFGRLEAQLKELEAWVDYSKFFDVDGNLLPGKLDILKNNFLLDEAATSRAYVAVQLSFNSLQPVITIPANYNIVKSGYKFELPAGTFTLPVSEVRPGTFSYELTARALVDDVPALPAGAWEPEAGMLLGCTSIISKSNSQPSGFEFAIRNKADIALYLASKGGDSKASIRYNIALATAYAGISVERLDIASYEDPTYISGITPFVNDDSTVGKFRYGGYTDVRAHSGFTTAVFYLPAVEVVAGDLYYKYKLGIPVYKVLEVKTWIEGADGTPVGFHYDYARGELETSEANIKVTVLTTNSTLTQALISYSRLRNSTSGEVKILQYYPLHINAEAENISDYNPATDAPLLERINTALRSFVGATLSTPFKAYINHIALEIGSTESGRVTSLTWRNSNTHPAVLGSINAGTPTLPAGLFLQVGPKSTPVDIPLLNSNSIIIAGW